MWIFIFVSVSVFAIAGASADNEFNVFKKCCLINQNIVKSSNNESEATYQCLQIEDIKLVYNLTSFPFLLDDSVHVLYGLPQDCNETLMIEADSLSKENESSISANHCYDRLVTEVINGISKHSIPKNILLTCNTSIEENFNYNVKFGHIRKCCPPGQGYDNVYHLCRNIREESVPSLIRTFDTEGYIYDVENDLHCKLSENSVEITDERFNLQLDGSALLVSDKQGNLLGQYSQGQWCIDYDFYRAGIIARICTEDCSSLGAFCFRKCCQIGHHYRPRKCGRKGNVCVPNTDESVLFNLSYYLDPLKQKDAEFASVLGFSRELRCPDGKYLLNSTSYNDRHNMTTAGVIESTTFDTTDYCIEAFDMRPCGGHVDVTAVFCFIKAPTPKDFSLSFVLISISAVCLGLTLVVYCSLSELHNLHGRTLICHVSTMLFAFSCLARVQYGVVTDEKVCTMLGYGIYFGFVAAFAWLNVMCLDIWWTFGSVRTVQPLRKTSADRRRFAWYSLYAWSVAIVLTLVMVLLDLYPITQILDSNMGKGMCWFGSHQNTETDWPHYLFFVIPMGIVTCVNFVLWILTARHCARVKSEVHRLQAGSVGERAKKRFRVDRAKYILTVKLWIVMGAGWVCELLSTLTGDPKWLWFVIDLINELQGVFIFLILVLKPKVYRLIKKKLGLEQKDAQNNGTGSTARTSSTFLSRTISSDANARLSVPLKQN